MGLFDKRDKRSSKKDDFDSPVENIDLSAPPAEPEPVSPAAAPPESAPAARVIEAAPPPEPVEEYDSSFGIDKAIELMRTLPSDNVELVVQVVKLTLESTKIKIATIIEDATRKQEDIQGRIKVLKSEIADFEKEIATRREEIGALEADFDETSTVKERLQLAEKLTSKSAPGGAAAKPAESGEKDSPTAPRPGLSSSPLGKVGSKAPVVTKK